MPGRARRRAWGEGSLLPARVVPIERNGPGRSAVPRRLPELTDASVVERRPRHTMEQLPIWPLRRAFEHHLAVLQPADDVQHAAAVAYPDLMPLAVGPVIGVDALPRPAGGAGPVLVQAAVAGNRRDHVPSDLVAVRTGHVPFTEPEVEVPELRRITGIGTGRRLHLSL